MSLRGALHLASLLSGIGSSSAVGAADGGTSYGGTHSGGTSLPTNDLPIPYNCGGGQICYIWPLVYRAN